MATTLLSPGRTSHDVVSRWPHPQRRRPSGVAGGFTILEALIGVVILTASIGALAVVTARQWSRSSEVDVLDRVENAVASDVCQATSKTEPLPTPKTEPPRSGFWAR